VAEAKARQLLTVGGGRLPSQFAPPSGVEPGSEHLQLLAMGGFLLSQCRIRYIALVAQQIRVPVLATTNATILRLEAANAAFHLIVRAGKALSAIKTSCS
jgi:hypothetical protein